MAISGFLRVLSEAYTLPMAKKMEFYEDADKRFQVGMKKILSYKPSSKRSKELPKTDPKSVGQDLNRS